MSTDTRSLRARPATYAGVFVVTLATLAYEIVLTRIFSVTMWYHFAFVAISIALFGTTTGALIVHLRPQWFTEDKVRRQMWRFALGFAVSLALAFVAQLSMQFTVEMNAAAIFSIVSTCAIIAVPFTCAGVVVCLALTRFPDSVNKLYAADLIGAGVGCLVLFLAFRFFDGPSLVILVAGMAAFGAFLLAVDDASRRGKVFAGLAMVVLVAGAFGNHYQHDRGNPFVKIIWSKEGHEDKFLDERWNNFSRVTVDGDPKALVPPMNEGQSTERPADARIKTVRVLIDGAAATDIIGWGGDPDETDWLRYEMDNLVYHAVEGADFDRAAVIGVGGGRDVLSALEFGVDEVTGIEINGNILDLLNGTWGDFSGHLDQDPRVTFVNDEARSWLARTDERFDSIQMTLIDTWAATSAGAFALTENSLYTTDSWNTFLDRLQPNGVMSATRWYQIGDDPPYEVLRTTALAAEALTDRGVENPRDHIVIYQGPINLLGVTVASVLVSPEPFTDEVLDRLEDTADEMKFTPILTPRYVVDDWDFDGLTAPGGPGPAIERFNDADISAPDDNRPFFFQMADVETLLRGNAGNNTHLFRPVATLAALALAVILLAAVCIGGPLVQMGRRTEHRGRTPYYLYFCGIGLGFLLVEISQLMRLSTFLGHPSYSLTVTLVTVLIFSGLGSMLVGRISSLDRPRSLLAPLVALLGLAAVFGVLTPRLIDSMADDTTPVRIAVAVALLAPMALLMGMPFSLGMRMASTDEGAPTAFLWGINGAMSVVASVLAMVIALFFGIAVAFYSGVAAYVLAAVSMGVLVKRLRATLADGAASDDEPAAEPVLVSATSN